jgi:hypothetical protein
MNDRADSFNFGAAEIARSGDPSETSGGTPLATAAPSSDPPTPLSAEEFAKEAIRLRDPSFDLDLLAAVNQEPGPFKACEDDMRRRLPNAYPFFLQLIGARVASLERLRDHPTFERRKRKPNRGNPALLTVLLATDGQATNASEWACMLTHAADLNMEPVQFAEAITHWTLKGVRDEVREKKKRAKLVTADAGVLPSEDVMPGAAENAGIEQAESSTGGSGPCFSFKVVANDGTAREFSFPYDEALGKELLNLPDGKCPLLKPLLGRLNRPPRTKAKVAKPKRTPDGEIKRVVIGAKHNPGPV